MQSLAEVDASLTGPGGPFELEDIQLGGGRIRVFKNRARNLRDILAASTKRGDEELFVFDDGRRLSFTEHAGVVASVAAGLREVHGPPVGQDGRDPPSG